jgi:hypothetical protein
MQLMEQIAGHLGSQHNLDTFTLTLDHPDLVPHITHCWNAAHKCGFKDSLLDACRALRNVRNVRCVTIRGLPEPMQTMLKERMESAPLGFFDLPAEVRNQIYYHAADWSGISTQLNRTMSGWVEHSKPPVYSELTTPTVLLLNRQITREAMSIIHDKPLKLTFPREHNMQDICQVPNTAKLISAQTLQHVKTLVIEVESWEWIYSLDYFLPNFTTKTSALQTLHFPFADRLKADFLAMPLQHYPDDTLHTSLSRLADIRGLKSITFSGDLPDCYTTPLARIMRAPSWTAINTGNIRPMAIKGTGEVVELDDGFDD